MDTRTEIVDNAQKHPRLSSSRPCGCLDMPAYTTSELMCAQDHRNPAEPTFQTLKQTVLQGYPSCATAPENHATRSTGAGRHTSGPWLPYHVRCTENLGDNKYSNAL